MSTNSIQRAFFASMAEPQAFRLLFDQQPDMFFFVKDRESCLIAASLPMYLRLSPLSRASPYLLSPQRSRSSCKRRGNGSWMRSAWSWESRLSGAVVIGKCALIKM